MIKGLIIAAVLIVIIILWVFRKQNMLVRAQELCSNSLSQIGVQQASRWDALGALADLTKGYSELEHRVLLDTIAARKSIDMHTTAAQVQQQEELLAQSFGRIQALAEAYPDLKSNTVYLKTMDAVQNFEDKVRLSRMVFNDTVTKFNRLVRTMPGALVANALGFAVRDYLPDMPGKADMPNLNR